MRATDANYDAFQKEMQLVWGTDKSMIEYCTKETTQVVMLTDGKSMVAFKKQDIKHSFYIGYSTCGQGLTEEEARNAISYHERNMHDYFIGKNMERAGFDKRIKELKDKSNVLYLHTKCIHGENQKEWFCVSECQYEYRQSFYGCESYKSENQTEDKKILIKALEKEKETYKKRLESWFKRYGEKKCYVSLYWVDE